MPYSRYQIFMRSWGEAVQVVRSSDLERAQNKATRLPGKHHQFGGDRIRL